ncbi:RNA-directed DNA polymerase, eukaryota, reverse transcriptase zinc-binding domain protein [Tanacetum coccineum]
MSNPATLDEAFSLARAAEARFTNQQLWELLRSYPLTLGEAFFRARIIEARFEDENNQAIDTNIGDPDVKDKQEVKKADDQEIKNIKDAEGKIVEDQQVSEADDDTNNDGFCNPNGVLNDVDGVGYSKVDGKWEPGDRWVDRVRLMDRFPRLFHLDRCKEGVVADKGEYKFEGNLEMVWDWVRESRGRVVRELEALEQTMSNTSITLNCKDTWKLVLDDSGTFSVKALSWKLSKSTLRAVRGRLLARVELDKKVIDLHLILCPNCDEMCETIDHSLVLCTEAMKVWEKVLSGGIFKT